MNLKSDKRSYQIFLEESLINRAIDHCMRLSDSDLQKYIDANFETASKLGRSRKDGAWREGRMFRDKAKIAIIELDNRKSARW